MLLVPIDQNIFTVSVSSILAALAVLILRPLMVDVILVSRKIRYLVSTIIAPLVVPVCRKICRVMSTIIAFLTYDETIVNDSVLLDIEATPPCGRCAAREGVVTYREMEAVAVRLGVAGWRHERIRGCEGCEVMDAVEELMESKKASEAELEEAFYVFDCNEDGFISAMELWSVMKRLGFEEGARLVDCKRMINAFDEDGDGRISFPEFRRMMENVA